MISRWDLDGDATDSVGPNHGSLVGAPAFGDGLVTSEDGGQAVVFDGTNRRVEVPNHASLQFTSAYTISAWIERGDIGSGYILVKGTDDYYLWMGAGDALEVGHRSADGTYRTLSVATPIRLGHKVKVTATFDGGEQRLYLNGRQIASVAQTNAARTTTGVLRIGSNGSDHWNGRVDKVRVHNTAQTAAEILAEYRAESLIIFADGFESGDTGLWIEEQEVGPTASVSVTTNDPVPAEGSFALRTALDDGDERAELRMSSNLHRFTEGDDIYIRVRVFLTAPFPVDSSAWGTILAQLHNAVSGGGPVVSLGVSGDPGVWSVDGDTNAATAGGEVVDWAGPEIETGRWHEFVIRVLHSADPGTGLVEVWHDGVKVASSQRLTLVNAHNYLKVGYYRDNTIAGAGIVGTDGLVIARQHLWLPPEVVTEAATDVDHDSAVLNGTVDPNGTATTFYFEYGEATAYGSTVPLAQNADAGSDLGPVAAARPVIGLKPETTYHYRIVATNVGGTDTGENRLFTTPAVALPAVEPTGEPRQTWAERLYEVLAPLAYADPELGYPLRTLCEGIGLAHQPLEDLVADTDDGPGWSALFDVDRCPVWALPWLAQLCGVRLPAGITEPEARERIRTPAGFARGTVESTIAAAQRNLTGLRKVVVLERTDGNAYRYTVVTRNGETPDPAAVEHEIRADKPVGLIVTYVVSTGPIVNELEDTVDDQVGTVDGYLTA